MLRMDKNIKICMATVMIYIGYIYTSITYSIHQVFWLPLLLLLAGAFTGVFFKNVQDANAHPLRLIPYYVIMSAFILIRDLMLGYPIKNHAMGIMVIGVFLTTFIILLKVVKLDKIKQFKTRAVLFLFAFLCSVFVGLLAYFWVFIQ